MEREGGREGGKKGGVERASKLERERANDSIRVSSI